MSVCLKLQSQIFVSVPVQLFSSISLPMFPFSGQVLFLMPNFILNAKIDCHCSSPTQVPVTYQIDHQYRNDDHVFEGNLCFRHK